MAKPKSTEPTTPAAENAVVVEPEIVEESALPQTDSSAQEKLVMVPESEWLRLLHRVSALESEFERFKRQYKMIHGTVQEIHYRFTQAMAEAEGKSS